MSLELTGTIKRLSDTQTFASGFQKKELVLLTEDQYPQPIAIDFLQEKIDLLDNYKESDKVKISINLGGREWTSPQGEVKYFNSITGWRIEKLDGAEDTHTAKPYQATPQEAFGHEKKSFAEETEEIDDLPF